MSQSLIVILLLSVAFPLLLLWYINNKNRKPISIKEYAVAVLLGLVVDGICLLIEKFAFDVYLFTNLPKSLFECFVASFFRNAFVEELFKLLGFCTLILLVKNKQKSVLLLYAIGLAAGFSMFENVGNITLASTQVNSIVAFSLGRIVSVFLHVALSIFSAFFITKYWYKNRGLCIACAFLVPYIIHGAHDMIVCLQYYLSYGVWVILLCLNIFDAVFFFAAYKLFHKTIINDTLLIDKQ